MQSCCMFHVYKWSFVRVGNTWQLIVCTLEVKFSGDEKSSSFVDKNRNSEERAVSPFQGR
jgi:hypothetical protein